MNIKIVITAIALISLFLGCEKESAEQDIPICIESKINEIINSQVWNPPAKIYSYNYKGQTVYYFPPRCCDIPSTLYDEDCNMICSPDGGLTGNGDGQCSDFFDVRTDERLIWEDSRGSK